MSATSHASPLSAAAGGTPASLALRQLCLTLALTLGAVVLVYSLWAEVGWKMLMLGMGWPHVLLGFLFYFGGVLRGGRRVRASFFVLALLTLAIWALHYRYDIAALIYIYFLYHAFRDEIFVSLWKRARASQWSQALDAAGIVVVLLSLVLLVLAPQQEVYRTVRSVEITGAQFSNTGWTLITFEAEPDSRGRDFYFHLQAPHTLDQRAFITQATTADSRGDGEMRVSDEKWAQAADLVFQPYYAGEEKTGPGDNNLSAQAVPVLLTGGHRVGQSFKAERDHLAGVWLPVSRLEEPGDVTRFVFRLTAPLFTYPLTLANLRLALIILLCLMMLWRVLLLRGQQSRQVWVYVLAMLAVFVGLQAIFKTSNLAEYALVYFSQFILVFHYFLWYVITFDKLRARGSLPRPANLKESLYDRLLAALRRAPQFTAAVIILNFASLMGVFWYYKLNAPPKLLYAFDYKFFLYFLAFHVTFSFKPDFLKRAFFRRFA
jgi:hypothetical protein